MRSADELNAIGHSFHNQGALDAARLHYTAALLADPTHAHALQNLGAVMLPFNCPEAALSLSKRALAVDADNLGALANLGAAYINLERYAKARDILRKVLKKQPDAFGVWHNLSLAWAFDNEHAKSLEALDKCLAIEPRYLSAKSDRGLALLALGDIKLGCEAYEVRWETLYKSRVWTLGIPEWRGEDLAGKRLLLHHEQGFGDSIMLVRFAAMLRDRGARLTIAVPRELQRLFDANFRFADIDNVTTWDDENLTSRSADFHSPMLSAMRWCGIERGKDIPRLAQPYITVPKDVAPIALPRGDLRVGLCWASGNHGIAFAKRRRYVPLELLFPLAELPGVRLISLQRSAEQRDILDKGAESFIFDPVARVEDFADTAAIIAQLDVVISVDSAVAHLAGAMGKPVLMLGPYTRCWRWWNGSSGAPWYDNFTIFAQTRPGSWRRAVQQVRDHVAANYIQRKPKRKAA